MIQAAETLAQDVGVWQAAGVLSVPRATLYRHRQSESRPTPPPRRPSPRALSSEEQDRIRAVLYEERFVDKSPRQIYAALLDDGIYLCSVSTMYRLLARDKASRERRPDDVKSLRWEAVREPRRLPRSVTYRIL
ncbi:MAG: hypothetical protein O2931_11150 [Planctomycetota bacterium]|nr:hypothetical protein [Planctomycetota bacterium]MDA1179341.1 hypothetical protein [Planctomycetota bacterium]